jgi:preprotein translocase subunit SecB
MNPSPIRLNHYHLTNLLFEPTAGYKPNFEEDSQPYPKFSQADFRISLRFGEIQKAKKGETPDEYKLQMRLVGKPKEGASFPYTFEVGVEGFFAYKGKEEINKQRGVLAFNGAMLLYGAMREFLLSLSVRFPLGPIMLPIANFSNLGDIESWHNEDSEPEKPARRSNKGKKKVAEDVSSTKQLTN